MAVFDGKLEHSAVAPFPGAFREIITKAVCGTGQEDFSYSEFLSVPAGRVPSSILGSSVTRLKLTEPLVTETSGDGQKNVRASGTFDINVWYSYNHDQATDVAKETVKFTELIPINIIGEGVLGQVEAKAVLCKAPQCQKAVIADNNGLQVNVDLGLYAEIIGETKVFVCTYADSE